MIIILDSKASNNKNILYSTQYYFSEMKYIFKEQNKRTL